MRLLRLPQSDTPRPWPLYILAAPATVAVWSGWVGLGEMTGFGMVHPLPGIADGFTINTAITLPVGVEAYAAYALGAWLSSRRLSGTTRGFAKWSALGALLLGGGGQIAYHLLEVGAAAGAKISAPVWITTIVACIPVVVLGLGATLAHLIHRDSDTEPNGVQVPALSSETHPLTARPDRSGERSETSVTAGSETQSSDPDREETQTAKTGPSETGPKTQTQTARKTKPAKPRQTGPRTKTQTLTQTDSGLLERARLVDSAHLQDHGRHISAENLRKALRIAKPAALELVKQVRGAHMDIAK